MSEVVPDWVGVITAWRTWRVVKRSLASVTNPTEWRPGEELVADCLRRMRFYPITKHPSPHRSCSCGIYGKKKVDSELLAAYGSRAVVWGRVAIWGRIYEGEKGVRGEFAYPLDIRPIFEEQEREAVLLAKMYGVPYVNQLMLDALWGKPGGINV